MFPSHQQYYATNSSPFYPGTSYAVGPPPPYETTHGNHQPAEK